MTALLSVVQHSPGLSQELCSCLLLFAADGSSSGLAGQGTCHLLLFIHFSALQSWQSDMLKGFCSSVSNSYIPNGD